MLIREAETADIPALQSIMNHYRQNSCFIWETALLSQEEVQTWLNEHTKRPYSALVAQDGEDVVGFASLSRFRPHVGYNFTAEDSIYLSPDYIGKGCGGELMKALLKRARENDLKVVTAWIDEENRNSIAFHEYFGFEYVGCMRNVGMLKGLLRSVVIMQYHLE